MPPFNRHKGRGFGLIHVCLYNSKNMAD